MLKQKRKALIRGQTGGEPLHRDVAISTFPSPKQIRGLSDCPYGLPRYNIASNMEERYRDLNGFGGNSCPRLAFDKILCLSSKYIIFVPHADIWGWVFRLWQTINTRIFHQDKYLTAGSRPSWFIIFDSNWTHEKIFYFQVNILSLYFILVDEVECPDFDKASVKESSI